jgi:hypothetical protein
MRRSICQKHRKCLASVSLAAVCQGVPAIHYKVDKQSALFKVCKQGCRLSLCLSNRKVLNWDNCVGGHCRPAHELKPSSSAHLCTDADAIRQGLLARGWAEDHNASSTFFDMKWAVKVADIDFDALRPGQIVNHFQMNIRITTKVGLLHCLRDMHWSTSVSQRSLFPRCYDLHCPAEVEAFVSVRPSCMRTGL